MPAKKSGQATTEQFSVTLPSQAIEMLEQLVVVGLYGNSRAEVARTLMLSRLEQIVGLGIIQAKRAPKR